MINRRNLMLGVGAVLIPLPVRAARHTTLRAASTPVVIGEMTSEMQTFNGTLPGPMLRMQQGERLNARVQNDLDDGTLVHWHGIRVPNQMDGVNVLTQDAIPPNESFDYRFNLPDAGTYWYHSHYLSIEQVSRGMFGPLIVEEATPPDVDHDIVAMVFDVLLDSQGRYDDEYYTSHFGGAGRLGNFQTAFVSDVTPRIGDRIRLRLINPSPDRVFSLRLSGLQGRIVALDGMALQSPVAIAEIELAPGQRTDVIADVTGDVSIENIADDPVQRLATISASGSRAPRATSVGALPAHSLPLPGIITETVDLVMQGGTDGGEHSGYGRWAFNDVTGLPRVPLLTAQAGQTLRIRLVNNTLFPHAIHLHGNHFWETDATGAPTVLRDTTLVATGAGRDILCVLDNPGNWLLHCHMLSHSADGMATWLRVT